MKALLFWLLAAAPPASAPTSAPAGFEAWRERLSRATAAELDATIREVDPKFVPPEGWSDAPIAAVEVFPGQLDADPAPEVVVQVRRHPPEFQAAGERTEAFWIGVFDDGRLVGAFARSIYHCNYDEAPTGLLLGFSGEGGDRALWMREQEVEACGTLIDFRYSKREYRLRGGRLKERSVKPPPGMTYDRMRPTEE